MYVYVYYTQTHTHTHTHTHLLILRARDGLIATGDALRILFWAHPPHGRGCVDDSQGEEV